MKGRSSAVFAFITISVFALAAAGCETGGALSAAKKPKDSLVHVTRVTYQPGEKGTSVKIYGTGRFEHTSYKLTDPLRIAVGIPNVVLDFEPRRVRLNNSAIAFLDVVRFKKVNSVRLELELLSDAGYSITQKKNYLELLVANAPSPPSGGRAFSAESVKRSGDRFTGNSEKDATIATLQENIAKLEQENAAAHNALSELEETNRLLNESLEEARIQLEEAGGRAKGLEARIVFMEGKLSDIQEKMAAEPAAPGMPEAPAESVDLAAPDIYSQAPQASEVPQATEEANETLLSRTESEIKEVVAGWLAAWNGKDINAYSDYYSDDFETETMDRETWLHDKRIKFAASGPIEITAKKMEVSLTVEGAVVIFEQTYKSPSYGDVGLKIISLTKRTGNWKIVSESWKPL